MKSQKKLELNQETVRNLTRQELMQAVGGVSGTCVKLSICCNTHVNTCFEDNNQD